MLTSRTTPEDRAEWRSRLTSPYSCHDAEHGRFTLRLLDDLEDAERAVCDNPNCAAMRNANDMIRRFIDVAEAADLFFHALQDRVSPDEFERCAERLRKFLLKAGYGDKGHTPE